MFDFIDARISAIYVEKMVICIQFDGSYTHRRAVRSTTHLHIRGSVHDVHSDELF